MLIHSHPRIHPHPRPQSAAKEMVQGRTALIAALREDIERVMSEMSIVSGDPEWLDLEEVGQRGIHRSVVDTLHDHAEMLREIRHGRLEAIDGAKQGRRGRDWRAGEAANEHARGAPRIPAALLTRPYLHPPSPAPPSPPLHSASQEDPRD